MSDFTYECSVCLDEQTETRGQQFVRSIVGDSIDDAYLCEDCAPTVVPLFEKAVENELEYPPQWGGADIDLDNFKDLMSDELIANFLLKSAEYKTPLQKRIYCQHKAERQSKEPGREAQTDFCNTFIQGGSLSDESSAKCRECNGLTCLSCHEAIKGLDGTHECDSSSTRTKAEIYEEGTMGKLWQRCPGAECGAQVELEDGCNAMACPYCLEDFCFICGEAADHDSDHWTVGHPCPRWNQPGDKHAGFDGDSDDNDDNDGVFDDHQLWALRTIRMPNSEGLEEFWAGLAVRNPDAVMANGYFDKSRADLMKWMRATTYPENGDPWETDQILRDNLDASELWWDIEREFQGLPDDARPEAVLNFGDLLVAFTRSMSILADAKVQDHPNWQLFRETWDSASDEPLTYWIDEFFWPEHEELERDYLPAYNLAMESMGPESTLNRFPMAEIFERWKNSYTPALAQRDKDLKERANAELAQQQGLP